jgi:proteasome beta subunit
MLNFEGSSFYELLQRKGDSFIPQISQEDHPEKQKMASQIPHGTTVLALKFREGVVIAGDRRATEGFQISGKRMEKVFKCDRHSAIAIAGAAGPCIEMARLFQTELEHYEKLEGVALSTDGKANKLSQMIKGNLPFAMQGLVVIPIFVGYDLKRREGRIFKYDVTGGRYEEIEYYATGSGGKDARTTLKKLYKADMEERAAVEAALEALFDAADEDVGTAGPDMVRGIYPTAKAIKEEGIGDIERADVESFYKALIERKQMERRENE